MRRRQRPDHPAVEIVQGMLKEAGAELRRLRTDLGLSLDSVSNTLGLSLEMYRKMETGDRNACDEDRIVLAALYDCKPSDIWQLDEAAQIYERQGHHGSA